MRFAKGHDPRRHQLTPEERRKGGQNSQAAGKGRPFARGADPRRHKLTLADCRKGGVLGFSRMMESGRGGRAVKRKIRAFYGRSESGGFLQAGAGI